MNIVNTAIFDTDEAKFRSIRKVTLECVDIFEKQFEKIYEKVEKMEKTKTFNIAEFFMCTLYNYLLKEGQFPERKINKWFKFINNNTVNISANIVLNKGLK